jgi:hypothetical protein
MTTERAQPTEIPPSAQVMQMLWPGAMAVQAIHVAATLRLSDLVADGPKTPAELAAASGAHEASLARLLRALTSLGLFEADTSGRYRQSAVSDAIRADHPQSMRRWAMMMGAGFVWQPIGGLGETVRTGRTAFDGTFGSPFFEYLAAHDDDAAIFNAAMSSMPAYIDAVVQAYDFSRFERIVDVGGGHGALLTGILAANPRTSGVLHDFPSVVAGAPRAPDGVAGRLEIAGGDFFEGVPAGADAYILSGILHDWNDEAAAAILRNCRRAITPNGTLVILDTVLTASSHPMSALMDLLMMVLTGGRERTEAEFRTLLEKSGFALGALTPTGGATLLEARPV